ncbi:MAG: ATP-binding protein [Acidobacteriota bacterium]|nr:ATP-binding protein [Acidobacteriota bacterium]
MSVRVKLLTGYLVFVGALVLLGGWSAVRLNQMGGVSRNIIAENYDSVVAAQDMKESLERQDSAALFILQGERERALSQLREHRTRFDRAFEKAANNITEPGELEAINTIRQQRDLYNRVFDRFVSETSSDTTASINMNRGRALYFGELEPLFGRLRASCDDLLRLNQEAMLAKSEAAAGVARRYFLFTLLIAGALVGAGIALAFFLANSIVRPLRALTQTTARIAGGDLNAKATITSHDEFGLLAAEYNRMGEIIRQLRRSDMGKLVAAQQMAEAAIDSLYDPVIVTDEKGCVTKLNNAAEELFGTENDNTGKHIAEIARDTPLASAVEEAVRSQRAVAGEGAASVLPFAVNGNQRAFRLRTTPMRDGEGRLHGAVTLLEDITHLREIDRVKSEFIATASHELRTPLTSVQMGVHLLLEGAVGELTDQQAEVLQACREDCVRLERLMRDLLDLSKLEAGESHLQLVTLRASELITTAVERLRPQTEAKDLLLQITASPDLPSVLADRTQIERVITNLVTNAMRHTQSGGKISISATPREGEVAVAVADTGSGIPSEHLPRIFDKFMQVPGAPSGGAGLGLAISKEIIEAHGGQISVDSEVNRGTTFTFTLPAVR